MKKLITLLAAILLIHTTANALVDNPPTSVTNSAIENSSTFTTPVQKYKYKEKRKRNEQFIPRHTETKNFKALGTAICNGDHKEVQRLLDSGVSPNQLQESMTPLGIAVQGNNIEAFTILINHKDINVNQFYTVVQLGGAVATTRLTAIADAIQLGNPEMMRLLLDKGATVDYIFETINKSHSPALMESQKTPLMLGFETFGFYYMGAKQETSNFDVIKQFEQLQRIADKTTNINRIFIEYNTPVGPKNIPHKTNTPLSSSPNSLLMKIITETNYQDAGSPFRKEINKIIISIMERGADINYGYYPVNEQYLKQMNHGMASLGAKSQKAHMAALRKNAKYIHKSVIMTAVTSANAPLVKYLFDKGASTSIGGDKGGVLFTNIISLGVLSVFIDNDFDINTVNHDGYGLIFSAVKMGTGLLEEMLHLGANPNLSIEGIGNALTFSSGMAPRQRKAVTKLLKEHGAVPYVPN